MAGEAAATGTAPYRTEYLDRAAHQAAVAAAPDGGVALVDHPGVPKEDVEDRRTRWVSYDPAQDEAVVAVRATGPLQYGVSTAIALASPQFIDRALPVSRLEEIDDPPAILRDARCIGALSDDALDDGQVLRDALVEWGEELEEMTTKLHHGEYNDRDSFRSDILRSAHGLAGTIVHLLDVVGIDIVREIRVPSGLDREKDLEPLAKSIAISAAIQSSYGAFASFRQLYESRKGKRETALTPDVDAADPLGELIGGFTICGSDLHRLEPALETALGSPSDLHDDAPEIAVPIRLLDGNQRPAFADAVRRMCQAKNLNATREAVSVFEAFTGSPYDAARALQQALETEGLSREIRLDEVRLALSTLPSDRILPDDVPTASKAVSALLDVERPVSQSELADLADVSTRSLRNHLDRLVAFDIIREVDGGYRLALSTRDERHSDVLSEA